MKRPVIQIQKVEELKKSLLKIEAFAKYLKVGKAIKAFETDTFDKWMAEAVPVIEKTLKMNIIKVSTVSAPKSKQIDR